jgi:hypothetical protein
LRERLEQFEKKHKRSRLWASNPHISEELYVTSGHYANMSR